MKKRITKTSAFPFGCLRIRIVVSTLFLVSAGHLLATDYDWAGITGDWSLPASWGKTTPGDYPQTTADIAYFRNANGKGTVSVSSDIGVKTIAFYSPAEKVTLDLGAGRVLSADYQIQFDNSAVELKSGWLRAETERILLGNALDGANVVVSGPDSRLSASVNNILVFQNKANNVLRIENGALFEGVFQIGFAAITAANNLLTFTGTGTRAINNRFSGANFIIGRSGGGNQVVVDDGASFTITTNTAGQAPSLIFGELSSSNSLVVSGGASFTNFCTGDPAISIGFVTTGNVLRVENGGSFCAYGSIGIGSGVTARDNRIEFLSGAQVEIIRKINVSDALGSVGNSMLAKGTGTYVKTAGLWVGAKSPSNRIDISENAVVDCSLAMYIGNGNQNIARADFNTMTVSSNAVFRSTAAEGLYVGNAVIAGGTAISNRLDVFAGGLVVTPRLRVGQSAGATGNIVRIWSGGIVSNLMDASQASAIGENGSYNEMIIWGGGVCAATNASAVTGTDFRIGGQSGADGNRLVVLPGGAFSNCMANVGGNNFSIYVGANANAASNRLSIAGGNFYTARRILLAGRGSVVSVTDGGTAYCAEGIIMGDGAGDSSGRILVSGTGSVFRILNTLRIGGKSLSNRIDIVSGAVMRLDESVVIGYGNQTGGNLICSENRLGVADGALLTATNGCLVGGYSTSTMTAFAFSNRFEVAAGGTAVLKEVLVGPSTNAQFNTMRVVSGGSVTNRSNMYVGYNGAYNELTVSNGTIVCGGDFYVGANSGNINNSVSLPSSNNIVRLQGTNSSIVASTLKIRSASSLIYDIGQDGFSQVPLQSTTTGTGTQIFADVFLMVNAPRWAARVGGKLTLLQSAGSVSLLSLQTIAANAVCDPAYMTVSVGSDGRSLVLSSPNRAGTKIILR